MTSYRYKGLSTNGAPVEGMVDAFDQQDATNKARANCRVVLSVEPANGGKLNKAMNLDIGELLSGGKMNPKKLTLLCSQLSIELRAGMALVPALKLAAENEPDKRLKQMLEDVSEDVHAGNGLADSFALRGPFLPRTFIETIRAGEESGHLDDCFQRLKGYYEDSAAVKSKVGSALIYPILLILVAIAVIVIIMLKAVPVFESSFASLGNELPGPTRALIGMSHFMRDNILIVLGVILIIVAAIYVIGRTDKGSHAYAAIGLNFPGIGMVNRMKSASQLCSTLGTMLAAGLPLVKAAKITSDVMDNLLAREALKAAVDGVVEGNRLTDGLRKSTVFPKLLTEMVSVGEATGNMEETLAVVNDYYTKEVSTAVTRALGIMEPVIILFMAAMVVFILLSVYLPLFSMYGSI